MSIGESTPVMPVHHNSVLHQTKIHNSVSNKNYAVLSYCNITDLNTLGFLVFFKNHFVINDNVLSTLTNCCFHFN